MCILPEITGNPAFKTVILENIPLNKVQRNSIFKLTLYSLLLQKRLVIQNNTNNISCKIAGASRNNV